MLNDQQRDLLDAHTRAFARAVTAACRTDPLLQAPSRRVPGAIPLVRRKGTPAEHYWVSSGLRDLTGPDDQVGAYLTVVYVPDSETPGPPGDGEYLLDGPIPPEHAHDINALVALALGEIHAHHGTVAAPEATP
jgi:hypothetical protein